LAPYHDASLTRSVLKPIRDVTFHYDFSPSLPGDGWASVLDGITKLKKLDVGIVLEDRSLLGQRYVFADAIRNDYMIQFLAKDIVSQISTVSARIGVFVDSLLSDLVRELEGQQEASAEDDP
jgi:hypothetical protein